jgi:hypothetical protein
MAISGTSAADAALDSHAGCKSRRRRRASSIVANTVPATICRDSSPVRVDRSVRDSASAISRHGVILQWSMA